MGETYLAQIFRFAFRRFVLRTDAMQIVAASALPFLFDAAGIKMPDWVQNQMLAFIGIVALGIIFLRLAMAPYFIWKEQNRTIDRLQSELNRPDQRAREIIAENLAHTRLDLVVEITDMYNAYVVMPAVHGNDAEYPAIDASIWRRINKFTNDTQFMELWTDFYNKTIETGAKIRENWIDMAESSLEERRAAVLHMHNEALAAKDTVINYLLLRNSSQ